MECKRRYKYKTGIQVNLTVPLSHKPPDAWEEKYYI
jgi:hypothetical protein